MIRTGKLCPCKILKRKGKFRRFRTAVYVCKDAHTEYLQASDVLVLSTQKPEGRVQKGWRQAIFSGAQ